MNTLLRNIAAFALLCMLWACGGGDRALQSALDRADVMMEQHPDSALDLLKPYDGAEIRSGAQRARFALLYSMALDKNCIDTANFNVLQPALDYYPTHGTDADKLRTLYYEGCIYQNAKRMDKAMEAWAEALQYRGPKTDSLTLARLLVAQGNEYYRLYQFDKYNDNLREAEKIYNTSGRKDLADKAFLYQFELSLNRDSAYAKKNIGRVEHLALDSLSPHAELARSKALQYEMHFGTPESLERRIEEYEGYPVNQLNLAKALIRLGRIDEAEKLFLYIDKEREPKIKYLLTKTDLEKAKGNFREAFESSSELLRTFDREQAEVIIGDGQFAEERTQWRHAVEEHRESKKNLLAISSISLLIAIMAAFILYLRFKNAKTKRELLQEKALRLEGEKKNRERHIEYINSQLLEIGKEKRVLEKIIDNNAVVQKIITERLSALNSLIPLAASGSGQSKLADAVESLMSDRKKFLHDTRVALTAAHPNFIAALEEKGLSEDEIEYLCLYAIGFSGKEAGNLCGKKACYNLSGDIRKKLGLQGSAPYLSQIVKELMDSL